MRFRDKIMQNKHNKYNVGRLCSGACFLYNISNSNKVTLFENDLTTDRKNEGQK